MNRERKYRVWDISHKTFLPTDVYALITSDFGAFGIMLKDWDNYKEGEYLYHNSQIQSDFTGLLDKNGKEIYEGDVLLWKCSKSGSKKEKLHTVSIEWGIGMAHSYSLTIYDNGEKWGTSKSYWNASDREIIGNVYENQNLIN